MGAEARSARITNGLTQAEVAEVVRISRQYVGKFEQGQAPGIALHHVFEICAVLGLDVWMRAYPAGDATRDKAQLEIIERFTPSLHLSIGWGGEVPMPILGDPRAWDLLLRIGVERWGTEVESHVADLQDRVRSVQRKRRDGQVDGVILVLADTQHHRDLVARHARFLKQLFPVSGDDALAALRAGRPPAGDALILI
ncbi:MAG: helix-turn-helix transcriptional regulator [Chloroflexota bacterium]